MEVIAIWLMTMFALDTEVSSVRTDNQVLETEVSVLETELQETDGIANKTAIAHSGDGMADNWEIDNGFNPTDPFDSNTDTDNDGITVLNQFVLQLLKRPLDLDSNGEYDALTDGLLLLRRVQLAARRRPIRRLLIGPTPR